MEKNFTVTENLQVNVGFDNSCIHFQSNGVSVEQNELSNGHKEADSRILLHPKHVSKKNE